MDPICALANQDDLLAYDLGAKEVAHLGDLVAMTDTDPFPGKYTFTLELEQRR